MPNPHRGEIEARLDGAPYRLCLTLGALAELEHAFGDTDMLALAERFQTGRLSARDAQRIIGAGLRGAGHDIADEAVAPHAGRGRRRRLRRHRRPPARRHVRGQTLRVCHAHLHRRVRGGTRPPTPFPGTT